MKLWWHMIIRGNPDETKLALDSLQGLYDGIVVAVDDREDSDGVAQLLSLYPNMNAYRQNFSQFGRYDLARQDALDRIPSDTDYVGWSDSDEILVTPPYEVRRWLVNHQPEAVICGIHYIYPIGGHQAGVTYKNGRVRIWKYGTRAWSRPCHEYPAPINGPDNPTDSDITFNHIKRDPGAYRASHHIQLMQEEIDRGNIGWKFYQAREYEIMGDRDKALEKYLEYIVSGETDRIVDALVAYSEPLMEKKDYKRIIELEDKSDHPIAQEYIAIAYYWLGEFEKAKLWHQKARQFMDEYPGIKNNDIFFERL